MLLKCDTAVEALAAHHGLVSVVHALLADVDSADGIGFTPAPVLRCSKSTLCTPPLTSCREPTNSASSALHVAAKRKECRQGRDATAVVQERKNWSSLPNSTARPLRRLFSCLRNWLSLATVSKSMCNYFSPTARGCRMCLVRRSTLASLSPSPSKCALPCRFRAPWVRCLFQVDRSGAFAIQLDYDGDKWEPDYTDVQRYVLSLRMADDDAPGRRRSKTL